MTHTVELGEFKGFDARQIIAMSTEDKKKLELVLSHNNNFIPCFELMTTSGVEKHIDINSAIVAYNKA